MQTWPVVLLALALAAPAPAGLVGWLTARTRDWGFIQQTGGLRIEQPAEHEGRIVLPVEFDVTGTGAGITGRPTLINSGLAVRRFKVDRTDRRQLVIRVVTQVVEQDSANGTRHYVELNGLAGGRYDVFYGEAGDPEKFLGEILVR